MTEKKSDYHEITLVREVSYKVVFEKPVTETEAEDLFFEDDYLDITDFYDGPVHKIIGTKLIEI